MPFRSIPSFPSLDRFSTSFWSAVEPRSPRSSIMSIQPPARPTPRTGGGPKIAMLASGMAWPQLASQLVHDGFVIEVGRGGLLLQAPEPPPPVLDRECEPAGIRPVLELIERDEHRAEVRPERVQEQRLAGESHGGRHAGSPGGDLTDLPHDPLGPLERGRVRKLDVDQHVAHVLRGDEASRRARGTC